MLFNNCMCYNYSSILNHLIYWNQMIFGKSSTITPPVTPSYRAAKDIDWDSIEILTLDQ